MNESRVTQPEALLREALLATATYDPSTGIFTLRRTGKPLGSVCGRYLKFRIAGKQQNAHRMAWLYVYRALPAHSIDHINGDRLDNRISNLRDVSHTTNMQNMRRANRLSKLGILGVYLAGKRYRAAVRVNGGRINIGTYDTPEEAHEAYLKCKREVHPGCTI